MTNQPHSASLDLPKWVKPQLCKLVDAPPQGPEWLHEIKYDGYRMHARLDSGRVSLLRRTGLDWTHKYPVIAAALSRLPVKQAYLDGELCGVRSDGKSSFRMIQMPVNSVSVYAFYVSARLTPSVMRLPAVAPIGRSGAPGALCRPVGRDAETGSEHCHG